MTVQELIEKAESSGLTIRVEGDMIEVRAPQKPQSEARALIEQLRRRKPEVIKALTSEVTPEALAASILAENTSAEATRILAFWKETFGVDLERVRERSAEVGVQEHLRRLRGWQRRLGE